MSLKKETTGVKCDKIKDHILDLFEVAVDTENNIVANIVDTKDNVLKTISKTKNLIWVVIVLQVINLFM